MKNEIVEELEVEKIYFLSAFIDNKQYFIYRGYGENSLFGILSNKLDGRLFLYLPQINKNYTSKSNLNGCFFISGPSVVNAAVAEFNSKACDVLFLTKNDISEETEGKSSKVIAKFNKKIIISNENKLEIDLK